MQWSHILNDLVQLACGTYDYDDYTPPLWSYTNQTLIMPQPYTFVQSVNPHHMHTPVGQSDPSTWSMVILDQSD